MTEITPFSQHELIGIALHLDRLCEGIREGKIAAEPGDYEVIKRLCFSVDGFESAFETPAHALTYQATLEFMQLALGKFYYEITQEAK